MGQLYGKPFSMVSRSPAFPTPQLHWTAKDTRDYGNYNFGYNIANVYGAANGRHECGSAYGGVKGVYYLADADGRSRRVEYVADKWGFRAMVKTNEPGTKTSYPGGCALALGQREARALGLRRLSRLGCHYNSVRELSHNV
ncbi:hypothetical protein MRX96_051570 [Rhipicephalus microplus]